MDRFIIVSEGENGETLELPIEEDGFLLLNTLKTYFPNASSLKYRTASGNYRGIRVVDGKCLLPAKDSTDSTIYYCHVNENDARAVGKVPNEDSIFTKVLRSDRIHLRKNWYIYFANYDHTMLVFTEVMDRLKIFFKSHYLVVENLKDILYPFILDRKTDDRIESNLQCKSIEECEVVVLDICLERPIYIADELLKNRKRGYITTKTEKLGFQHVYQQSMIDSNRSSVSESSDASDNDLLQRNSGVTVTNRLKTCQQALVVDYQEMLAPHEKNSTRLIRPNTMIEVLIYCKNVEVCRLLALHVGLLFLDDTVYKSGIDDYDKLIIDSIEYIKFTGAINKRLSNPNAKLYDLLQTYICRNLIFGYNSIGLTSNCSIFENLKARVKCSIRVEDSVFHETIVKPHCNISVKVKRDDFLDYLSALGNILNEIMPCKICINAVYRRKNKEEMEYYNVNLPIICIIPYYIVYFFACKKSIENRRKKDSLV